MTALAGIFGGSLLLISGLFAFKDWERQRGRQTAITAFFNRHSPAAERLFRRVVTRTVFAITVFATTLRTLLRIGLHRVQTWARTGAVIVGAHIIHIARGEHLMAEGRIPSTYFKLLHRHKEKLNGTDIPKGIAQPDVLRRVTIRTAETEDGGGAMPDPQVE